MINDFVIFKTFKYKVYQVNLSTKFRKCDFNFKQKILDLHLFIFKNFSTKFINQTSRKI